MLEMILDMPGDRQSQEHSAGTYYTKGAKYPSTTLYFRYQTPKEAKSPLVFSTNRHPHSQSCGPGHFTLHLVTSFVH